MAATVLATIVANSPFDCYYTALFDLPLEIKIGTF